MRTQEQGEAGPEVCQDISRLTSLTATNRISGKSLQAISEKLPRLLGDEDETVRDEVEFLQQMIREGESKVV